MKDNNTNPDISGAILKGLQVWNSGDNLNWNISGDYRYEIMEAMRSQKEIGWQSMMEGLVSNNWVALQQEYYTKNGSRRTGKRWEVKLIHILWRSLLMAWQFRNDRVHGNKNLKRPRKLLEMDESV